jgi:MFS transporter, UMF1 family
MTTTLAPEKKTAASIPSARASRREIFGWAMFDFANQAYTLLIITVVFGDLFTRVIVGDRGDGFRLANLLWSLTLTASYLLVVFTAPVLGAITDFSAARKRFLFLSYLATVLTTSALYFIEPGWILAAMLLVILSNYFYSVGESFIASFLPDLGPPEDLGKISGFGWALGYVGGLFAAGFALIFLGEVSHENFERIRWVGPFAGGFFLLCAIPTFLWLKERGISQCLPDGKSCLKLGAARLATTLRELRVFRDMAILLVAIFFSMAGISIIITFAFIYGAQVIGWDPHIRNAMFIVVQITAAAGAVIFGLIQDRLGAKVTFMMTLGLWVVAIIAIYATPQLAVTLGATLAIDVHPQQVFLVVGCLAGLSLGSSQSAGRALVGILAPRGKQAEFFGFWGLASKLAAVFGILGLGLLQAVLGLHNAILFCIFLFLAAMVAAALVDQQRGRRVAETYRTTHEIK